MARTKHGGRSFALVRRVAPEVQMRTLGDSVPWKAVSHRYAILDVQRFYDTGAFTDCQLVAEDGSILRCHRVVLAGASPVFAAMFTAEGMQEAESCTAHLTAGKNSLDLLLQFIYGKTVDVPLADAMTVYQVAHQYQINTACSGLTSTICEAMEGFTAEALCYIMQQAYELGDAAESLLTTAIAAVCRRLYDHGPDWLSSLQEFQRWHLGLLQHVLAVHPVSDKYSCSYPRVAMPRVANAVAATAWVTADNSRMQHWEGLMQQLALEQLTSAEIQKVKSLYLQLLQMPGVEAAVQRATDRNSNKRQRTNAAKATEQQQACQTSRIAGNDN